MSDYHVLEKIAYSDGKIGIKIIFHFPMTSKVNKINKPIKDILLVHQPPGKSKIPGIPANEQIKIDQGDIFEYPYMLKLDKASIGNMDIADMRLKIKATYPGILKQAQQEIEQRYDFSEYEDNIDGIVI